MTGSKKLSLAALGVAALLALLAALPAVRDATIDISLLRGSAQEWRPAPVVIPVALAAISLVLGFRRPRSWAIVVPSFLLMLGWDWVLLYSLVSETVS